MTVPIFYCECNNHEPPLFAACNAKLAPGEKLCAWCRDGHVRGLGTWKAVGRTIELSLRLWVERTFGR